MLAEGRYKPIRTKLEREIDRLHGLVEAVTKERIVLHPDPHAYWVEADFQQRRDLVRLVVQRVEVTPGRPALRGFDASRVRIEVATPELPTLSLHSATERDAPFTWPSI